MDSVCKWDMFLNKTYRIDNFTMFKLPFTPVKSTVENSQNFVAFSEYMNLNGTHIFPFIYQLKLQINIHWKCQQYICTCESKYSRHGRMYLDMVSWGLGIQILNIYSWSGLLCRLSGGQLSIPALWWPDKPIIKSHNHCH